MRDGKLSLEVRQLETLWVYLAFVPRDRRVKLSSQIARDFEAGNRYASHLVHSGIFKNGASESELPALEAMAIPSIAVSAQSRAKRKAQRHEAQGVAGKKTRAHKGRTARRAIEPTRRRENAAYA